MYGLYLFLVIPVSLEILVRLWGYSERYIYDPIYQPYTRSPGDPLCPEAEPGQRPGPWQHPDQHG